MRILNRKAVFNHHPFAGRGASLYVGIGDNPSAIVFRRIRALPPRWIRGTGFAAGTGVRKGNFVAQVTDANQTITIPLREEWAGETLFVQVRTFAAHVENTTNYRPQQIEFDDELAIDEQIHGTGEFLAADKLDGGHYRFRWVYSSTRTGLQPLQFRLVRTAGPTAVADVVVTASAFAGVARRNYDGISPALELTGLQHAGDYTFELRAESGSVSVTLDTLTLTADASGPPAPTGLSAEVL